MHHDLPASMPGGEAGGPPEAPLHDHPLPSAFRLLALVSAVLIFLFGGLVLWTVHQMEAHDAQQRAAILAELDRRTAERKKNEEKVQQQLERQREGTRQALCAFLASDLEETPALLALEARFACPPREGAPR